MTAYGAVLSLRNTINNILRCSRFSLVARSQQIIQVLYKELQPLKNILKILDRTSPSRSRKKVNALDGRIKDAIWRFEDSLESLLTQHIPSPPQTLPDIVFLDLQSLEHDADSLIETLKDIMKEYIYEVENMAEDEPISSSIGFDGTNSKMIGLSDQFLRVKTDIIQGSLGKKHVYALYGTAGVGKTTLAMQIYQDPEIQRIFDFRVWVTVGRVPQSITQILRGIIAQVQLCGITQGDEEIGDLELEEIFDCNNSLIVLDDVWEIEVWNFLLSSLPNIKYGCIKILLTARHYKCIYNKRHLITGCEEVRLLNEEESMDLLCDKVFGDESCPPQLHKPATKIAKLCEGLPLMIVTVADILSKSEHNRDPFYWIEVAERRNSVFTDAYNQISEVLLPSYDYLPQHLKMPFLFMGVFPQDYVNPVYKIKTMLTAEGLWDGRCLRRLAFYHSLVLRDFKSVNKTCGESSASEYKTCQLHSSWRHLCREEANKNKFYHVLNKLIDAPEEGLKGQRGLCLENNILFGIKEFRDSVRSSCASSTRSLLLYGPFHQYPIPIDVGFRLLREVDALTQRFYTFPKEILSLVQLKYLALTCNGELPSTISKLFNLRVLIIHPHMNIRRRGAPSYVPIQIWDMKELEHIEILGQSIVAPSHVASLTKLATLVGVNASICTLLELSRRIPNIKKLGIMMELTPYDDHNDLLICFGCIATLESVETFKVSITNPVVKHGHVLPMSLKSLELPYGLVKLHLSGTGFPWEYMDIIGCFLPNLKVLKLRSYAVHGSHWEARRLSFLSLEFLLIEESDLVQWKPGYGSFTELSYLSMKHCYKLEEIHRPESLCSSSILGKTIEIEVVDCHPLALSCATQLQLSMGVTLRVIGSSSFYEKPTKFKCERYGGKYIARMGRSSTYYGDVDSNEEDYFDGIIRVNTCEGYDVECPPDNEDTDLEDTEEEDDGEYTFDHEHTKEEDDGEYTFDHEHTKEEDDDEELVNRGEDDEVEC
ncbi:putative late blight resistance protein R1B-12 [Salvia divinorum]|uniref:Late blight resistance protein R1B-12 n=1 Tax=Salvia divinorum TaxID=28513 RepID=A0ABD1GEJ1_SALDI